MAKALYDNLADAPDELSFRKGDIVTVIERDVDGIVGWWLCLLHGRQGIAPGNRLQIIPPFEVNNSFRNAGSQGSLSADDLSDSFDANLSDGVHGPEYDILPAPVKATHGQIYDYPSPKNIKDVYTSESKTGPLTSYPNYATPKGITTQSDYDIVPTRNKKSGAMNPAELYDIPQSSQTVQTHDAEQLYDFPARRPTIQQKNSVPSPKSVKPDFQNVLSSFTAIPEQKQDKNNTVKKSNPDLYGGSDIYDTPKSMKKDEIYDTPPSSFSRANNASKNRFIPGGSPSELYDVLPAPKKNLTSVDDIYDTPPSAVKSRNENAAGYEIYDVPPTSNNNLKKQVSNNEIYDTPPRRQIANDRSAPLQDIYDYPPRQNTNEQNPRDEIYDVPPQDIYDTPPRGEVQDQDNIYDHPPSQDIYDEPPRREVRANAQPEDIYDHPPSQEIYDHPPRQETYANSQQDDIYDHPPNRTGLANTSGYEESQGLYDVPTHHDIGKVMSDISHYETTQSLIKPYGKHRRERNNNNSNLSFNSRRISEDDDDYVDYQDIYGKEPPAEMVKEMEKVSCSFLDTHPCQNLLLEGRQYLVDVFVGASRKPFCEFLPTRRMTNTETSSISQTSLVFLQSECVNSNLYI